MVVGSFGGFKRMKGVGSAEFFLGGMKRKVPEGLGGSR